MDMNMNTDRDMDSDMDLDRDRGGKVTFKINGDEALSNESV
jgi:hypothetical protein